MNIVLILIYLVKTVPGYYDVRFNKTIRTGFAIKKITGNKRRQIVQDSGLGSGNYIPLTIYHLS